MKQIAPLEIGIPVRDLDRMLNFYQQVFDCEEVRRADIPAALSSQIGVAEHGYVNVWLKFPGGEILKLVCPPQPPETTPPPDFMAQQTGIAYFTIYCADMAAALDAAESAGASLVSQRALAEQADGVKLAFLRDPEGNVFELVQP
ncbi:MAG: VOC family protein [Pseudomonadota bacterium]